MINITNITKLKNKYGMADNVYEETDKNWKLLIINITYS